MEEGGSPAASGWPVDLAAWKRREHFRHFRAMPDPWFSVAVEVEATGLRHATGDASGRSFFLAALHLLMRAVNQTEALRMRLRGEGVWVHERVHASSTILQPDETFVFAQFPSRDRFADFQAESAALIERLREGAPLGGEPGRDDLIYHSSLPWIRFTAFANPRPAANESIPRIVFGQCYPRDGGWHMPLAVEVHHALVDGLDVARFIDRFQAELHSPALG